MYLRRGFGVQFAMGLVCASSMSLLMMPSQAWAGGTDDWISYTDETATRLVGPAALTTSDFDEKDYAWADIDQDGDIDLVVVRKQPFTSPGRRENVLFMNEGGVLVDRTEEYATASDVAGDEGFKTPTNDRDVVIEDVTGDGWLDLVTVVTISDGLPHHISHPRIYRNLGNDGDGNWQGFIFEDFRIPQFFTVGGQPHPGRFCSATAVDVDEDGDLDLYFGDYDSTGDSGVTEPPSVDLDDRLLINDGAGVFTDESFSRMTTQMLDSAFSAAVDHGDMNGDGHEDIVKQTALQAPQYVAVIYNNPASVGNFNGLWTQAAGLAPYHIDVGDLNNDDRLDFIISDDNPDSYMINTGNGPDGQAQFFRQIFSFESGSDPGFASNNLIVDLNEDGWNDVIIADVDVDIEGPIGPCSDNRRLVIYRNLANPPFVTMREQAGPGWRSAPGLGTSLNGVHDFAPFDLDGDGSKDLVVGLCTGTRVFMGDAPLAGGNDGDCDADGDVDLVDFAAFQLCFTGPGGAVTANCGCSDTDSDGDVDLVDFANFQLLFTGPM